MPNLIGSRAPTLTGLIYVETPICAKSPKCAESPKGDERTSGWATRLPGWATTFEMGCKTLVMAAMCPPLPPL